METWEKNFVSYKYLDQDCYIFCDTNASYASIHQHLEHGFGKPCIVSNGNSASGGQSGACLAISYEARNKGIKRGTSVMKAKSMIKDLTIYESCLPLYDTYADLYDKVLEWIVPKSFCYRGSCDEVIIHFNAKKFPYTSSKTTFAETKAYIKEKININVNIDINDEQIDHAKSLPSNLAVILAICYLIRDTMKTILGLPISLGVAPSICLAKALIDHAKPIWFSGKKHYNTLHDSICFPQHQIEANTLFRPFNIKDLCGVKKVASRLSESSGITSIGQIQDHCDIERVIRLTKNKHLGEVIWHNSHGRDDVLGGYLAAIRDRR